MIIKMKKTMKIDNVTANEEEEGSEVTEEMVETEGKEVREDKEEIREVREVREAIEVIVEVEVEEIEILMVKVEMRRGESVEEETIMKVGNKKRKFMWIKLRASLQQISNNVNNA